MWLEKLKSLKLPELVSGKHEQGSQKLCLMELIAFMEREPHSDQPKCVCPTLTFWGITLNDTAPSDEYRQRLLRLAPMCVGTKSEDPFVLPHRMHEDFSSYHEYEMFVRRTRGMDGRLREHLMWPGQMRAEQMERFARWIHGDRIRFESHRREHIFMSNDPTHAYDTARFASKILGEAMHRGSRDEAVEIWLMAVGVFESAIICGPHTPEMDGWVKPSEVKRAKQWVKEFAVA